MTTQLFTTKREPAYSREVYVDERWVLAFNRASEKRRQAIFVSHDHFQVHSSRSTKYAPIKYSVTHTGRGVTGWECTCPSGFPTTACWHRAAVLRRLQREPHLTNPPPAPLTMRSEIARSKALCEKAGVIQAQTARLKVQFQEQHEREMAGGARNPTLESMFE